jgi:hypothetical protein
MCFCDQPVVNGQYGYKWQPSDIQSIRRPHPPETDEDELVLYDGPGRCGGIDAHSHHYRLTKRYGSPFLLVQHGSGKERIRLHVTDHFYEMVVLLNATQLYWWCHTMYYAYREGKEQGTKEIKVRKGGKRY